MKRKFGFVFTPAFVAATVFVAAAAQTPQQRNAPTAPQTEQSDPACAQGRATVGASGDVKTEGQSGSLSEKLARSKGVICPPEDVDPDIKAPTPHGGPMPVIPPPGSPGGNQSVQPK